MADIFISYAKEDRDQAEVLAAALTKQGWSVFWDRTVPPGLTWRGFIGKELEEASCVLVAWSEASVKSEWVLEEAERGKNRGVLIPVLFEGVHPPFGFGGLQAVDLSGWEGDAETAAFQGLVGGLERLLGPSRIQVAQHGPRADTKAAGKAGATRLPGSAHPDPPTGPGAPTWEEDERLNPRIFIEGGTFQMGSLDDDPDAYDFEKPQHTVTVSSFWIQRNPVTNEDYRRFSATHELESGRERHPVVEVTWEEAMSYAKWLGGSLPTETQWEYAARGTDGRKYPWGASEPSPEHANYSESGVGDTTPVGKYRTGATPEGVHDLAGNVWEWCSDWYGPYEATEQTDPLGPPTGTTRVVRGGSLTEGPEDLRGALRLEIDDDRYDSGGFRVAWVESGGLE